MKKRHGSRLVRRKIYAFDLANVTTAQADEALDAAIYIERFKHAAHLTIGAIHDLKHLFQRCVLGDIEVYIGRTVAEDVRVLGRWNQHFKPEGKNHDFGAILFRCATEDAIRWESAATGLLKRLDEKGKLCVANAKAGGGGEPRASESCIYMTWRLVEREVIRSVTRSDLPDLTQEVAERADVELPEAEEGISPLTRPTQHTYPVDWHPVHGR